MNRIPLCAAALFFTLPASRAQTPYVYYEARHTHSIGLTPDGTRLLVLNSPDARLSVFDVSNPANPAPVPVAEIPVGMEPVSLKARTNDEVRAVNELSDSVSAVSLSGRKVLATLRAGDEPADVVFAGGKAFVSCARSNNIRVFDAATRAELAVLDPYGLDPRALTVNAAAARLILHALLRLQNGQAPHPRDHVRVFGALKKRLHDPAVFRVVRRIGFHRQLPHRAHLLLRRNGHAKRRIRAESFPVPRRPPHIFMAQDHRHVLALKRTHEHTGFGARLTEGIGDFIHRVWCRH